MAREHASGSTTGYARGNSLWNRAFIKGACSRPSCYNIFFAAIIKVAYTWFKADKGIMDALVHLGPEEENGGGGAGESNHRRARPGNVA